MAPPAICGSGRTEVRRWQMGLFALVPIALIASLVFSRTPVAVTGTVYAYDTVTSKLYTSSDAMPPFEAPSGLDSGVLANAVIFSGDTTPTIIYLMTYTAQTRESILRDGRGLTDVLSGTFVRRPEDKDWTPINSVEGKAIRDRVTEIANGRLWTVAVPP